MTLPLNPAVRASPSETASDRVLPVSKPHEKDCQSLSPSLNKFSFALSSGVTPVESESYFGGGTSKRGPNLSMDSVKATPMESTQLESTQGTCNTFLSTVNSLSGSEASSRYTCEELTDVLNLPITSPTVGKLEDKSEIQPSASNLPLLFDVPPGCGDESHLENEISAEFLEITYPPMPVVANKIGSTATRFSWTGSGESSFPSPRTAHTLDPPVDLPSLLSFQGPEIPALALRTMSTTHHHTITRRIENTIIKNAIIYRCSVKNCHITNCQITDSKCEGGFLATCKLVNTRLKNIPLITSSLLDRCLVKGCRLTNTIVRQGAVKGCRLQDSNLKQVGVYYSRLTRTHLIQCEYDFDEQLDCTFDDCRREGDPEQYFGAKNVKEIKIKIAPTQGHNQKNLVDVLQALQTQEFKPVETRHPAPAAVEVESAKPDVATPAKARTNGCCSIQ